MAYNKTPMAMTLLATAMASALITTPATADDAFFEALTGGEVSFSARARYENVDQEGISEQANAFTVRTTLGYKTGLFHGFGGFVEMEDVSELGSEQYNDTSNGRTEYPVVVDPKGTEVNQAYLFYTDGTNDIKFGRQEITFRKAPFHRFVGNVLWRQNHQSYDGLRLSSNAIADVTLDYAYINKINSIFGDEKNVGIFDDGVVDVSGHLFNAEYKGLGIGTVSAYAHLVDYKDLESISNKIIGARLSGAQAVSDDFKVIYTVEYAQQDDYKNGSQEDHNYYLAEVGGKYKGWLAKVSHEVQEGDGTTSFKTRLGTNHAYQGWADKFLNTPNQGLKDTYVTVVGNVLGAKLVAVYHDFETDEGGLDAGEEFDILLSKTFAKHYTVAVKYADYQADEEFGLTDTKKFWLLGQVKF
jgi:hypothetical protein